MIFKPLIAIIAWLFIIVLSASAYTAPLELIEIESIGYQYPHQTIHINNIKKMLSHYEIAHHPTLISAIYKTLLTLKYYHIPYKPILTVIDYSKPSNQKRLWIFDLKHYQLLYQTYVAHGLNSGTLNTVFFSNKNNSKASSIGIYLTEAAYHGREGASLRLKGLDLGYNDQAENRAIVMHGGWYLSDHFIQTYHRPGRSWGCPAVPEDLASEITHTIQNNTVLITYYPDQDWLEQSKFLQYYPYQPLIALKERSASKTFHHPLPPTMKRDDILFLHLHIKQAETSPVLTLSARDYQHFFNTTPPLSRMLRRPMEHQEYIALSPKELEQCIQQPHTFNALQFIIPTLRMERGYYLTEMKKVNLSMIKKIEKKQTEYLITFTEGDPLLLSPHSEFIRWVGL